MLLLLLGRYSSYSFLEQLLLGFLSRYSSSPPFVTVSAGAGAGGCLISMTCDLGTVKRAKAQTTAD